MSRRPGRKDRTPITGTFPVPYELRSADARRGPSAWTGRVRRFLRRRAGLEILLAVALGGPMIAWFTYRAAARQDRFVAESTLGHVLAERAHEVRTELLAFAETLHSCGSLFDASEYVSRAEFATFTRAARARHPAILAIGWAPRVAEADREAFEASVAASGVAGYRMTARGAGRTVRAAPPLDEHFPILYVEPNVGNEALLGFDLASERVRHEAILRAVETARVAATAPLDVIGAPAGGPGADVVLCVYDHATGGARERAAALGVLCVAFRFADVLETLRTGAIGAAWSWLDVSWADAPADGRATLVHPLRRDVAPRPEAPFAVEHRFELAGRAYVLRATPTARFLAARHDDRPLLLATLALASCTLVGLVFYLIARYWRSGALERQARTTALLLHSLGEGVVMADLGGRVRTANAAALRALGVSMADLEADDWPARCRLHAADGASPCAVERIPLARAARGEAVDDEVLRIGGPDDLNGRWLAASARPLLDESDVLQGGVMVLRDVTAERLSAESLRRLSSAVAQTTDGVYVTDAKGLVLEVNPGFRTTTGLEDADVLGAPARALEVDPPEDPSSSARRWVRALEGEPFRGTVLHRRRDGGVFESEQAITPVKDVAGRVTHAVVVVRDLTASRRLRANEAELRLAAEVQQRLYPRGPPLWEGLDVAGAALPAVATCGDYFDYVRFPDGTLALVVGDVSGHGLGPALLMSETRAYLHALVDAGVPPDEILRRINAQLRQDLVDGTFVTLMIVSIDPRTRRVSHASAGHTPALLFDATSRFTARLDPTGPALGVLDAPAYRTTIGSAMAPGDVLVLMTDGVSESERPDGGLFDEAGVIDAVGRCVGADAGAILAAIQGAIAASTVGRPRRDDITLVVCRNTATAAA